MLFHFSKSRRGQEGFTYVEIMIVMGLMLILGIFLLVNLNGRRRTTELTTSAQRIAALVREAQSRSVIQASSSSWGVHFDNRGATPFYALFSGTYSTSSRENVYALPQTVGYTTSTIASGRYAEMTFDQISGMPSGSSTIGIYLLASPASSSTLSVASSGAVSY
jgi:type II secretory pathway pseudopilin PulG